jgi:hypothetical protein
VRKKGKERFVGFSDKKRKTRKSHLVFPLLAILLPDLSVSFPCFCSTLESKEVNGDGEEG